MDKKTESKALWEVTAMIITFIFLLLISLSGCSTRPPVKFEVVFNNEQVDTILVDKGSYLREDGCFVQYYHEYIACNVKRIRRLYE